jgi:hypothetical protein
MNTQYWVVTDTDFDAFTKEVNRLTQGGWQAKGGVSTIAVRENYEFKNNPDQSELFELPQDIKVSKIMWCQAVVCELDDDDDDDDEDQF